jgi:ribosomal protein S18 acetylase RimI-like enzyme
VKIRAAKTSDEAALRGLWEEFEAEVPEPEGFAGETWDEEWAELKRNIASGGVFLAEDGDNAVGMLEAEAAEPGRWHVQTVHVRPASRRQGVARELLAACAAAAREAGAGYVSLEVLTANETAMAVWQRFGFETVELTMTAPLDELEARLGAEPAGPSRASSHIQTDDRVAVDRAVAQFVPRFSRPDVRETSGGWIRISDPELDADRDEQDRFTRDLSDRLGAVAVALSLEHGTVVRFRLYERGRMVDEYLSLPSFYGPLDRADELALEANPTLVARLTGADRDEVRSTVRTAGAASELPPAEELYESIARLMGLEP